MRGTRISIHLGWGSVSALEWTLPGSDMRSTVLLLHGGGVDNASLSWGNVGPALAEAGYRVIAPDHPGFGESPRAPWLFTQENLVNHVGELADALELKKYAVGGLSLGGGMTIGHVLDRPGRMVGAMMLSSYGIMPRLSDGPLSLPSHSFTWMLLHTGLLGPIMRSYARSPQRMEKGLHALVRDPARRTPELIEAVMAATRRPDSFEVFEQWQREQVAVSSLRTDYSSRLSSIACPTLIIHGTHDTGVPIERARDAARAIPDAAFVEAPGAGHWVQRDAPQIVMPAMTTFLNDLEW